MFIIVIVNYWGDGDQDGSLAWDGRMEGGGRRASWLFLYSSCGKFWHCMACKKVSSLSSFPSFSWRMSCRRRHRGRGPARARGLSDRRGVSCPASYWRLCPAPPATDILYNNLTAAAATLQSRAQIYKIIIFLLLISYRLVSLLVITLWCLMITHVLLYFIFHRK